MKNLLFPLLLFIIIVTNGQTNWRKGVVTKNDGIELKGEINDKEWTVNPKEIEFRGADQTILVFTAHEIKSFSTNRPSRYEAFPIEYDGESQDIANLSYYRNPPKLSRDTLFLKVIVRATLGLFELVDSNGRTHFFANSENGVEELLNRRYKDPATKTLMGTNEKFKQQLLLRTGKCIDLQPSIKQLKYIEETLRNMVVKINKCNGNQIEEIWEGEIVTKRNELGVTVQLFLSSPEFTFLISDFSKINFGGGLFYEVYSKKRPNRLSLYNELLFKRISQDATSYTMPSLEIDFNRIKMINSLRFSYSEKNGGRLYWGIGIGTSVRINTKVNGDESISGFPDYNRSEFELGFMASGGKTFSFSESFKLSAELRYEVEQGPFSTSSPFLGNHNIGLSLGFKLR